MKSIKTLLSMTAPLLATAALVTACDGSGLGATGSDRELALEAGEEGDFPIEEGEASTIAISNNIGKITLTAGGSSTNVHVRADEGPDYDALAEEGITVVTWLEGDQLVVEVNGPDTADQAVDIEIEAPSDLTLALRGDEHAVTVTGMRGRGAVRSGDGDITLADYEGGDLALESDAGNISFSASDFGDSRVAINSGSGDIDVSLPSDASFTLAATSISGSVSSGFDDVTAFGGFAGGEVNGGGSELALSTDSGDISVQAD